MCGRELGGRRVAGPLRGAGGRNEVGGEAADCVAAGGGEATCAGAGVAGLAALVGADAARGGAAVDGARDDVRFAGTVEGGFGGLTLETPPLGRSGVDRGCDDGGGNGPRVDGTALVVTSLVGLVPLDGSWLDGSADAGDEETGGVWPTDVLLRRGGGGGCFRANVRTFSRCTPMIELQRFHHP